MKKKKINKVEQTSRQRAKRYKLNIWNEKGDNTIICKDIKRIIIKYYEQ